MARQTTNFLKNVGDKLCSRIALYTSSIITGKAFSKFSSRQQFSRCGLVYVILFETALECVPYRPSFVRRLYCEIYIGL